jgi:hypothetical protein
MVGGVRPGSVFGPYRIDAVEREDATVAVLRAQEPREGRAVSLHVAGEPPGSLATVRFLERAHRLGSVAHPNLLGVYDTRTLEGRAVAVAEAPVGRRLDALLADGPLPIAPAVRIARQLASAVDALEEAGAAPPPLVPERIWIDRAGDAHLDGLDAHIGVTPPTASSSASLARLLEAMTARATEPLQTVITRALDGAYLSVGQVTDELRRIEAAAAQRRRVTAVTVAVVATLALIAVLGLAGVLNP